MGEPMAEVYLKTRLAPEHIRHIKGNVSGEVKEVPVKWLAVFKHRGNSFAVDIANRLKVAEVWALPSPDDPMKLEGKVVIEIDVTQDMCNSKDQLHDGCVVFLLDEVTAITTAVNNAIEGRNASPGVSSTINAMFHAPAPLGTRLRVVATSLSSGYQTDAARCEIFDTTSHRVVASGAQLMMPPSKAPKKAKL